MAHRTAALAWTCALASLLAGCLGGATLPGEDVPHRVIAKGTRSGITEGHRSVVTDAEAWRALWSRHDPAAAPPEIDFSREHVAVVILGSVADGCERPTIAGVAFEEATRTVHVGVERSRSGGNCIAAESQPFEMAAFERRPGNATFVDV